MLLSKKNSYRDRCINPYGIQCYFSLLEVGVEGPSKTSKKN